jgi:hypothetical protein
MFCMICNLLQHLLGDFDGNAYVVCAGEFSIQNLQRTRVEIVLGYQLHLISLVNAL